MCFLLPTNRIIACNVVLYVLSHLKMFNYTNKLFIPVYIWKNESRKNKFKEKWFLDQNDLINHDYDITTRNIYLSCQSLQGRMICKDACGNKQF